MKKDGWILAGHVLISIVMILVGAAVVGGVAALGFASMEWWTTTDPVAGVADGVLPWLVMLIGFICLLLCFAGLAEHHEGAWTGVVVSIAIILAGVAIHVLYRVLASYDVWRGWFWWFVIVAMALTVIWEACQTISEYRYQARWRSYGFVHEETWVAFVRSLIVVAIPCTCLGFIPWLVVFI